MFSLIIPCHNPDQRLFRLFDSLKRQTINHDEIEIIVVDDASDNLDYRKTLDEYGLNVKYTETDVEVHCPGNTREAGLPLVTQAWLCFSDQDDFFEDDAFEKVKDYILSVHDHPIFMVSTIFRTYDEEEQSKYKDFAHKEAWLHGKFYSMTHFIDPFDIHFKKDLVTHEDIYFNSLCLSHLYNLRADWDYLDVYTYCWCDNPDSLTRRETQDRGYLFENFNDYLVSAAEAFWEQSRFKSNVVFRNQVIMTLLHAYFYYEFASYYYTGKDYQDIILLIKNFLDRMINELDMSPDFIIDFVYADPNKYDRVEADCKIYCTNFIPKTSFRDFVYRLSSTKEEKEVSYGHRY